MPGRHERLTRLARAASTYRFGAPGWHGALFLAVSLFDVVLYAAAITLVMASVFGLAGVDRFVATLIGLAAFRWSVSCATQAFRLSCFIDLARPFYRSPLAAVLIAIAMPPSIVFLVSVVLIVGVLVLVEKDVAYLLHAATWAVPIMAIHLVWNILLVLMVMYAHRRRVLQSEVPVFLVFGLLLIVSPVAYQFDDIPTTATQLLTSFNPASHLIAAYQNALWFGQVPSLEVLPLSALLAAALGGLAAAALSWRGRSAPPAVLEGGHRAERLSWNGHRWSRTETGVPVNAVIFRPWRGELPWIKGRALLRLLRPAREDRERAVETLLALAAASDADRLLETSVPVCSERARDHLCLAAALSGQTPHMVLDGLLETSSTAEIGRFDTLVRKCRTTGHGMLTVICGAEVARVLSPEG